MNPAKIPCAPKTNINIAFIPIHSNHKNGILTPKTSIYAFIFKKNKIKLEFDYEIEILVSSYVAQNIPKMLSHLCRIVKKSTIFRGSDN